MNDTPRDQIRIAGICGSLRPISYTRMALSIALKGAQQVGAEAQLIDLRDYELAFADGRSDESSYPQDVFRLRHDIEQAHGILLATPQYHGGYSGVLKNALDLMGFREIQGKMIALIGVSGGNLGAPNALNGLRAVGRALRAWVIPDQVSIPEAWKYFDDSGRLQHPELEERLLELGRQVTRFAYLHNSKKALEFLHLWEASQPNPGGGEDSTPN